MKNRAIYVGLVLLWLSSWITMFCTLPIVLIIYIFIKRLEDYWDNYIGWLDDKILHYQILIDRTK